MCERPEAVSFTPAVNTGCLDKQNQTWEKSALDLPSRRASIDKEAKAAEARRSAEAELKSCFRKDLAADCTFINLCTCQICGRSVRAKIGLFSHMRTHNR